MRYQTLQQAIQDITESHDSDIQFYSGLESEFDVANDIQYPALIFTPPSFDMSLDLDTDQANKTWKIHLEAQELISSEASTAEKQEALDRTGEYIKDIVLELWITYGYENKTVTKNNVTETLDFVISSQPSFVPFIDLADGVTGWMVDFEITEGLKEDICHLSDVFSS
jgi:hypothetical protein